jgi:hypothetical protein
LACGGFQPSNRNDKRLFLDAISPRRFVNIHFFVGLYTDKEIGSINLSVIAFALPELWLRLPWAYIQLPFPIISSLQTMGGSCSLAEESTFYILSVPTK